VDVDIKYSLCWDGVFCRYVYVLLLKSGWNGFCSAIDCVESSVIDENIVVRYRFFDSVSRLSIGTDPGG
jgi:hypothetical protein